MKCPNAEFFLVCIFLYSDWIRRFTLHLDWIRTKKYSVVGHFSRNYIIANSESFAFKAKITGILYYPVMVIQRMLKWSYHWNILVIFGELFRCLWLICEINLQLIWSVNFVITNSTAAGTFNNECKILCSSSNSVDSIQ